MSLASGLSRARQNYASYLDGLGTTCAIFRPDEDSDGKLGTYSARYVNVPCIVGLARGAMQPPFVYSRAAAATASTPGAVPVNFLHDQDCRAGDLLVIGSSSVIHVGDNLNTVTGGDQYTVGIPHDESPLRISLTVDAEIKRVPPL